MKVNQINIKDKMTVSDLIKEFELSGVLGSGRVARATNLLANMIGDNDTKVFLSLAGPLVPGGLRNIVAKMIKEGMVDVIITSGANVTHDLLEAFGGNHYSGFGFDDEKLHDEGMGRIGDIYTKTPDFEVFEKEITNILATINDNIAIDCIDNSTINSINNKNVANNNSIANKHNSDSCISSNIISIKDLLYEIGNLVSDENSILHLASKYDIPIFAPGLIDSMLGLQLWMFNQSNTLVVDAVADMDDMSNIVFSSKKVGAVLLGGGLPKHYALASNLLKGGVDSAIQITMDRSETGSLSGAPLEEAKSWSKAQCGSNLVSVVGDVTILFPLILAGAIDKLE
ncbi:MAG: deoxyhypusine synthase [Methanobacteriaceae archaeon]